MANEKKFAVLIDADNVSGKYIKLILDEVSNDGIATYKRIYGDWTKPSLASWKNVLLDYSVVPVQQYSYTTGKNATDSAMIIDAMDILYSGHVDGFCLVSSDSDFTRLASRLRESGMTVIGMGESKTPNAFIAACHKFKYLDVLSAPQTEGEKPAPIEKTAASLKTIRRAVLTIVRENSDEEGWAFISDVGNVLIKRYPDFDVRNYGFAKFTPFIKSMGVFESRTVIGANNAKLVYIRDRNQAAQLAQKAALDAAQQEAEASARAAGIILPEEDADKPSAANAAELPDAAALRDSAEIADIASDVAIVAAAEAALEQLPNAAAKEPVPAEEGEIGDEIVVSTEIPAEPADDNADGRVEKVELVRGTPGKSRSRRRGGRNRRSRADAADTTTDSVEIVAASVPESAGMDTDDLILVTDGADETANADLPAASADEIPAAVPAHGENSGENGENSGGNPGENMENSGEKSSSRSRRSRRGRRGGRGKSANTAAPAAAETVEVDAAVQESAVEAEAEAPAAAVTEPVTVAEPVTVTESVPAGASESSAPAAEEPVSAPSEEPQPRRRGRPRKTEAEKEADRLKKATENAEGDAQASDGSTEKPRRASRSRKSTSAASDEPKKATRTRRRKAEPAAESSTESAEPVSPAESVPEIPAPSQTAPAPVEPERKEGDDA